MKMNTSEYPLAKKAYIVLKEWTRSGVLLPNKLHSESELSKKLSISRTPVRSALQHLERDGLIIRLPQRGYYVYPFSPEDVDEVYEVRKAIEGYALEFLSNCKDTGVFEEARKNLKSQNRMLKENDFSGFIDKDRNFHKLLVGSVGNSRLERIFDELRDLIAIIGLRRLESDMMGRKVLKEHRSILESIERGDSITAKRLLYKHFDEAAQIVKDKLNSERREGKKFG